MKRWLLALAGAVATPAAAQPSPADAAWQPPTLTSVRYDEDWSALADPQVRAEHWTGAFKYMPLGDDARLITGAEVRARYEANLEPLSKGPDNDYLWLRAMPYADLQVGPVRAFVEPIAAYAIGVHGGPGPTDATGIDVLQAFADIDLHIGATTTVILRGGREQMSLGTERLVGTRYGPNVPLAYDGGRVIVRGRGWRATGFWVRPVESRPGNVNDRSSPTRALWGVYGEDQADGIDLYYLGFHNDLARYARGGGREDRQTIGTRYHGTRGAWSWNAEAIAQFGTFAGQPIRAWSTAIEATHQWPHVDLAPALTLRANLISGDGGAGDRHLGDFNALFPKGKYFGELSPVGPRNLKNVHAIASLHPTARLTTSLALLGFWRMRKADGVYDVPGNLIGVPVAGSGSFIGKQAEFTTAWRATQELTFSASVSVMDPGSAFRGLGHNHDIGLIGLETSFRY